MSGANGHAVPVLADATTAPTEPAPVKKRPRAPKPIRFVVLYGEPGEIPFRIFGFECAVEGNPADIPYDVIPAAYLARCLVVQERDWLEREAERKRADERFRRSLTEVLP